MAEQTETEPIYTADDFLKDYDALTKKTGFALSARPVFFKQDNGSFSIKIEYSVSKV